MDDEASFSLHTRISHYGITYFTKYRSNPPLASQADFILSMILKSQCRATAYHIPRAYRVVLCRTKIDAMYRKLVQCESYFNPNDTIIISTQGVPVTNHAGNMKADSKEQIWNHHSGSGASGSNTLIDARLGKLYLQLSRQRQCFCFVTSAWQFHSPTRWQAGQPESILPFPKNILRIFTGLFRITNSTEMHQKAC